MSVYKTARREILLGFLKKHGGVPFTVREIVSALNSEPGVETVPSESTAYRMLRELEKDGRVRKTIDPANREYLYTFADGSKSRVNMRCKVCGNVYAADSETSRRIIEDAAGSGEISADEDIELLIKCKHCKDTE